MKIDNGWKIPEDTDQITRFKFGEYFFRLNYYNTHNDEVNLVLNRTTIPQLLEKEPKSKPKLSGRCEACSRGCNHFIWINETTPAGETHKEKYAIHTHCYKGFKQAINHLKENHADELLLETI